MNCPECGKEAEPAESNTESLATMYVCFNCREDGYYFTEADIELQDDKNDAMNPTFSVDEEITCGYCGKQFETLEALRFHKTEHEAVEEEDKSRAERRDIQEHGRYGHKPTGNLLDEWV